MPNCIGLLSFAQNAPVLPPVRCKLHIIYSHLFPTGKNEAAWIASSTKLHKYAKWFCERCLHQKFWRSRQFRKEIWEIEVCSEVLIFLFCLIRPAAWIQWSERHVLRMSNMSGGSNRADTLFCDPICAQRGQWAVWFFFLSPTCCWASFPSVQGERQGALSITD